MGVALVAGNAAPDVAGSDPGAALWSYPVGDRLAGAPVAASRWIAAVTAEGRLFALESGRRVPAWGTDLGSPVSTGPRLQDFRVIVTAGDGTVHAVDLRTGETLWTRSLGGTIPAAAEFAGGSLWVPLGRPPGLVALAPATGEPLDVKRLSTEPATPPVGCGDRIVIGTADGRVVGFAAGRERPVWERRCGDVTPGAGFCDRDAVLIGCDSFLYRIGVRKGKVHWRYRSGGRVLARPLAHGRYIYFGSFDNQLYVLKRNNGHLVRTVDASHRIRLDPVRSGPLLFLLPDTAEEIAVHRLPGADPIGRMPLPEGMDGNCTLPVVAGNDLLVVGCGGDSPHLFLLRIPAPAGEEPSGPGRSQPEIR